MATGRLLDADVAGGDGVALLLGAEIAPTGRKISWRGASLYTVDAGEIVSVLYHADQAGLMAQLTAG